MPDVILAIFGILLLVLGLLGCILPVLPGPPLSFLGLLLLRFTHFAGRTGMDRFDRWLWILGSAAVVVTILDYIVPVWGTRHFGGSKAGTWGAAIGLLVGFFLGPVGLVAGPFAGAVLAEMLRRKGSESLHPFRDRKLPGDTHWCHPETHRFRGNHLGFRPNADGKGA